MNKYKIKTLSNQAPLITVPLKSSTTATVLVIFKTGSKYENRENNGLSHFVEHMFFKGTKRYPNTLALSSALDSLGGEYNAFTSKEYTGYWIKVASSKLTVALGIINDMLLNSKFDSQEIEREKGVIIEELNMYEDNPLMHIEDVFETCLYGDSPAGWDTIGTKKNIRSFRREDFINYVKTQYGARSMFLIITGKINQTAENRASLLFSKFPDNLWQNKLAVREKQFKPQLKIVHKKTDQTNLSLGVRTYSANHAQALKVKLLSVILGGSMSSRLFINLRERHGLAYYVRTSSEVYTDSGYLTTQAGVPAAKVKEAVKIILTEYKKITQTLISDSELRRAKDLLQGRSLLQMEATDNLAIWYAHQAIFHQHLLSPQEFLRRIKKITAVELRNTAKKIFVNKGLNLAIIGQTSEQQIKNILKF